MPTTHKNISHSSSDTILSQYLLCQLLFSIHMLTMQILFRAEATFFPLLSNFFLFTGVNYCLDTSLGELPMYPSTNSTPNF